jgi:hypothetical protein
MEEVLRSAPNGCSFVFDPRAEKLKGKLSGRENE